MPASPDYDAAVKIRHCVRLKVDNQNGTAASSERKRCANAADNKLGKTAGDAGNVDVLIAAVRQRDRGGRASGTHRNGAKTEGVRGNSNAGENGAGKK